MARTRPGRARSSRSAQLTLVTGQSPWRLTSRTRTVGRAGVGRARDALADARRPRGPHHDSPQPDSDPSLRQAG